jgi:hypothetical protein
VLLGIKYEAARIGEVSDEDLATIEEQMKSEIGEGWAADDEVLRGRDAVRREHGLPGLYGPDDAPAPAPDARRSLWRRILKR